MHIFLVLKKRRETVLLGEGLGEVDYQWTEVLKI
jgi:hypothetical protein